MAEIVIKPEPKKPEHSVAEYVKYFDRIARANKWSDNDAARVFTGMLEIGSTVLDELDSATIASWKAILVAVVPQEDCYREVEVSKFFSLSMGLNETIDEFQRRCKTLVLACYPKFAKANRDLLTRDRFVHGLTTQMKSVVLNQRCAKLEEAIQAALLAENVKSTLKIDSGAYSFENKRTDQRQKRTEDMNRSAIRCFRCDQFGHFARNCPRSMPGRRQPELRGTQQGHTSCVEKCSDRPMIDTVVNGYRTKMLIDSGSSVSLLPSSKFQAAEPTNGSFRTATNSPLKVEGILMCHLEMDNWVGEHQFYVGEVVIPVLGMDFLKHHGAILQTRSGELSFMDHRVGNIDQDSSAECNYMFTVQAVCTGQDQRTNVSSYLTGADDLAPEFSRKVETGGTDHIVQWEVQQLQDKYTKVFCGLGSTEIVTHNIETGVLSPFCLTSHRLPVHLIQQAKVQIASLEKQGIIRRSRSPWNNPVVLVPKTSGEVRIAIDFRKLNEHTKVDAYPMPRVDECLERLKGANYFSLLDCNSGYYQIKLRTEDQQKTAFRFEGELWEFTRMPFGLSTAPATFCRLMRVLFANESNIVCYLDDICIFSRTYEEHKAHMERALDILEQAGMTLNEGKCQFFRREVEFLGFRVKADHIYPTDRKWKAMKEFPRPKNLKELQRFLGLLGYYRNMIPNFGLMVAPLFVLTQKKHKFLWGREQEKAFQKVKEAVLQNVVRVIPDPDKEFIVRTDACADGIGALLLQETDSGDRVIIECASKQFKECQKRYPVIEQEAFGIMFAIDRWERFLLGAHFVLETDHKPLEWLQTKKDCRGKLGRWALRLASFNFSIRFVPGRLNADADALSRVVIGGIELERNEFKFRQKEDTDITKAKESEPGKYRIQDGLLYRAEDGAMQLCVPKLERLRIWNSLHEELGHGGPKRVCEMAKERFYWPGMREDIKRWARRCHSCNVKKDFLPSPARAPMVQVDYSQLEPMEKLSIDVMGPFPQTEGGFRYLLVLEDCFSKWAEAKAVDQVTSKRIIEWLQEIFARFAMPREIILDQGANMESFEFKKFCGDLGISLRYITAYHHQSNPVERLNRTLVNLLRMCVSDDQKDWADYIPSVLFAYRVSVHSSIKVSPFEAMYGKPPRLPVDLKYATQLNSPKGLEQLLERKVLVRRNMREELRNSSRKATLQYDKHHKVQDPQYEAGKLVYIRQHQFAKGVARKLARQWKGPFQLIRPLSEVDWLVKGRGPTTKAIHVNLMKPCEDDGEAIQLDELRGRGRPPKQHKTVQ